MIRHLAALIIASLVSLTALSTVLISPAGALTAQECRALVEEGRQAREDLQKLIEAAADDPSLGNTDDPDIASYVADLIASTQINEFGFVDVNAGEVLELCLPEGTERLTLYSHPIVLWEGLATHDAYPVAVVVPAGIECGDHELRATGDGVDQAVSITIDTNCQVDDATVLGETVSRALPRTGAALGQWVAVGLALVVLGYSIVRSRRQAVDPES